MNRTVAAAITFTAVLVTCGTIQLHRGCSRVEPARPLPPNIGPVSWSDVPDLFAVHPVGILPASADAASAPAPWIDVLSGPVEILSRTMNAEERAELIAAVGFLNAIDFRIGEAAGLKQHREVAHADRASFPTPLCTGFIAPADPRRAIGRVRAVLDDPSRVMARLPGRWRGPDLRDAVRARAALFAGALGSDARTVAALSSYRNAPDPRVRAAAALGLLDQGDAAASREILTGNDTRAIAALLGALSAASPPVDGIRKPFADRSLDSLIPPLLHKDDTHVRAMALAALAVRVDDRAIAKHITDQGYWARTPEQARALVLGFPHPDDVAHEHLLWMYEGWIENAGEAMTRSALVGLSRMRSSKVPGMVARLAASDDLQVSRGVLEAVQGSAALDPACALQAVMMAVAKWRGDETVVSTAVSILQTIDGIRSSSHRVRVETEDLLAELRPAR